MQIKHMSIIINNDYNLEMFICSENKITIRVCMELNSMLQH